MATITETVLIDDIDGTPDASTLVFGLDGASFEIDLSESNMAAVRSVLEPLVEKATRVDGKRKARRPSTATPSNSEASKVREWARANGFEIGNRGRISSEVTEAFTAAQG